MNHLRNSETMSVKCIKGKEKVLPKSRFKKGVR